MAKVLKGSLAGPDDPIFKEGPKLYTRRSDRSSTPPMIGKSSQMGKSTFRGFAKSGDVPPLQGAFVTGANLRSSSKTKSTTPQSQKAAGKAAAGADKPSNPETQER